MLSFKPTAVIAQGEDYRRIFFEDILFYNIYFIIIIINYIMN